ncbi:MAG: hypothetical protein ACI8ZN_002458 [Bacteroidia bacterium]|jgi:hypothetical protein
MKSFLNLVKVILITVLSFVLGAQNGVAQVGNAQLTHSGLNAQVNANGNLFVTSKGAPSSWYQDSLKNFFAFSNLWMLGFDNGTARASLNINPTKTEQWPGPIDTATGLGKDPLDWNKVWHVTRDQVTSHSEQYQKTGYKAPTDILTWPASHAETNVPAVLAPFVDWNGDAIYAPNDGDYPYFLGDEAVYFICNDDGEHVVSGTDRMGVEIQGMLFTSNRKQLEGVIFGTYYLINRSSITYEPFFIAPFADLTLGNASDNFVQTSVNKNMIFGYNADDVDEGEDGFNSKLPFAGLVLLNAELYSTSSFVINDPVRGLPASAAELNNVLEGKWKNGNQKFMNGNGTSGSKETKFMYPGNTDVKYPSAIWSEESSGQVGGERNVLATSKIASFPSKSFLKFEFAYFTGLADEKNDVKIKVNQTVEEMLNFYSTSVFVAPQIKEVNRIKLYPNPVLGSKSFTLEGEILRIDIQMSNGVYVSDFEVKKINRNIYGVTCSEPLASGIYYIYIHKPIGYEVLKLIVTK